MFCSFCDVLEYVRPLTLDSYHSTQYSIVFSNSRAMSSILPSLPVAPMSMTIVPGYPCGASVTLGPILTLHRFKLSMRGRFCSARSEAE